jgi:Bacterial pullanase-associated domain
MTTKRIFLRTAAACLFAASLPAAMAQANPPEGSVAINYSRCDGAYDPWALHLWQRGPGGPAVPGISWENGMAASGKNAFGVYWHLKLTDFPGGKVNYIIHKGDIKEQGGKDQQFDANTTKEIWVNSGDRKIYTSLDEATKGRAETPCK